MSKQLNQQSNLKIRVAIGSVFAAVFVGMLARPFVVTPPDLSPDTDEQATSQVVANNSGKTKNKSEIYKPLHNVNLPDFAAITDVSEKKRSFFGFLAPHVKAENKRLSQQRDWLISKYEQVKNQEQLSAQDVEQINKLMDSYRIKHQTMSQPQALSELIKSVDGLPMPLVLMQAANESAWGTSRFAKVGLNFFGKWCFSEGCGMVPLGRPAGKTYEVAAYKSVKESVVRYFKNINTNNAYSQLRDIRFDLRENNQPLDGKALAKGLMSYSERGEHYIEELTNMINSNQRFIAEIE